MTTPTRSNADEFADILSRFCDRHPEIRRAVERRRKAQEAPQRPKRVYCVQCAGEGGLWDCVPGDKPGSVKAVYRHCSACKGLGVITK